MPGSKSKRMARGTYLPPEELDAAEMEATIEKDQCEDIGVGNRMHSKGVQTLLVLFCGSSKV